MNFTRKSFPSTLRIRTGFSILFLSLVFGTFGQTVGISGIINTVSARIDAVFGAADTDVDSIRVNSTTGFSAGDTVLIHMSVGAGIITANGSNEGKMSVKRNSGKYAIFIIQSIDIPGKFIILNSTLPDFVPLVAGEFGQVVKVPTYRRALITNTLTCNPYDTASKTGGILVLMVKESLIFNADINVDGKGFPGANPDAFNYTGTCSTSDPINYLKVYFTSAESNFSALKGYGVTYTHNSFARGNGANINGGGGGNGKFSGGGGGANGGDGGSGGNEYAGCAVSTGLGGKGGRALSLFYDNIENRIGFGGGGGTSSQILPDFRATKGGNGGGIVIIVCDSLIGNRNIYARGESVTELSTAGSGGGGGGGTIILHVNTYLNSPKLWVTGGNGGSVSNLAPLACGPGGGGGGGVIWHNGTTLGGPSPNLAFGYNGTYNSNFYGSTSGSLKPKLSNLVIPIRGFIFNHIPNADTISFGNAPRTINAARPVGGTGVFFYNWLESTDSLNWTDAAGKRDTVIYTPPPSTNITKYYRRAVYNPPVLRDTSNVVKMYVRSATSNSSINNNTSSFKIYPNPFRNQIDVELPEYSGLTTVSVFDYSGRKLVEKEISSSFEKLDLRFLGDGVYIFRLSSPAGSFIQRVVKQQ